MLRAVKGEDARYYFLYRFVGKVCKSESCAERLSETGQEGVRYMLGRDIVGYLAVKILETDRELSHCFVRFLAYREELPELFSFGDLTMEKFEKLCAYDLKGSTLR